MSSPQMASSPSRGLLSQWWSRVRSERDEHDEHARPPLLSTHSSSAVMQSGRSGRGADGAAADELWVINGGKKVQVPPQYRRSPIFGVPLGDSIKYASVQISLSDSRGNEFVYGFVPVVVAKCSSFLKQHGQTVRGIFRLSGSQRRINLLQELFNTAPKFGKDVDWAGFTVHDAANTLRRFFTQLPEPVIPHRFYQAFREPLEGCEPILAHLTYKAALVKTTVESGRDEITPVAPPPPDVVDAMIAQYERLLFKLPPVNLHLFVYLLDLMDVFESMSEENLMPAFNLATIFLMSMLPVPEGGDLENSEYQLSRLVLVFLIENSSELLSRVRRVAVEEHELRRGVKSEGQNENPGSSQSDLAIPELSVTEPTQVYAPSHTQTPTDTDTSTDTSTQPSPAPIDIPKRRAFLSTADSANEPIWYSGRKHSKSMSSAAPPQQLKSHRDSFISSLRRQMSTSRRDLSGSLGGSRNGSTASLSTTASPASATSDENSRRRSWLGRKR